MKPSNNKSFLAALSLLCLGLLGTDTACAVTGELLWSEEFNTGSTPDSTTWSYDLGAGGWGNNELQEYTDDPANARIENGTLVISALRQEYARASFSSARIRTQDKLTFKYGTVEARIRVPDLANGLWPAFWTIGNNFSEVGWPACGELDILEMGHSSGISEGVVNQRVGSAAHWQRWGSHHYFAGSFDAPSDLNDGFHLFRMEWTPEVIKTFVDGKLIWAMEISDSTCVDCTAFHQPHFLILNLAVGGGYPQIFNPAEITAPIPAEMQVDYVRIYDNGFTELGGSAVDNEVPVVGAGHSGAWFNPETAGQGQFLDIEPQSRFMFLSWFTYTGAETAHPREHQWYTAQGNYQGDTAVLELYETLGGRFDHPQEVISNKVGEAVLSFADCNSGVMFYRFDNDGREGSFPLERVIPGSGNLCQALRDPGIEAEAINRGMDGAWFDPDTSGQGFFIDVHSDSEGEEFIFVSWFTYGDATTSGQRWLTAQGNFEGSIAEIDIYESTGGSFDAADRVETIKVGTMDINFADCEAAVLSYTLDAEGRSGDIAITRVVPGAGALCKNLAGLN